MIISLQIYNNKYKRQNVWLTNQTVIIPVRTEYDENGKPVHSLEGVSFEEAFDKLKQFVEQNGHLPFATSGEYECSLRRWQQEINHDIRPLTHTQYKEFEEEEVLLTIEGVSSTSFTILEDDISRLTYVLKPKIQTIQFPIIIL